MTVVDSPIGSLQRPLRVAVVGSGPSGFYAADALLKLGRLVANVDMFERLPTPYGLVRGGVAPDHQSIKSVSKVYERIARNPSFRFMGNVTVGENLTVAELVDHYDQIVFAVGNELDRRLGIPGEGSARCTPAAVFVGWYNGHPDYRDACFDLTQRRVAIVGNGNVAIDVARILAKTETELRTTDIAEHALSALATSQVRTIYLLGRRGPVQAAFTPAELKELGQLEDAVPVVRSLDLELDPISAGELERANKQTRRNLEILHEFCQQPLKPQKRQIVFRFFVSPLEVLARDDDGSVGGLLLGTNELRPTSGGGSRACLTAKRETLDADVVLPAIGFTGEPLAGVPFDQTHGTILNDDGRVLSAPGGTPLWGQYVVGWARSGPRGLIGAHKKASAEVVEHLLEDLDTGRLPRKALPPREAIVELLQRREIASVSFGDWQLLDDVEKERGQRRGAPRDKLTSTGEMLALIDRGKPRSMDR